ncbi:superoxide dismutase, Ni [Synechococcus sp. PCC 7336]|uniref:superoxide dismutase, Ni n=1 Tax=Synechococcus sp. PCC 7336 TaxID=195250 RepID=UPI00034BC835
MSIVSKSWKAIVNLLEDVSTLPVTSAHCDIPCGVYEPDTMFWAAETVLKMHEKLSALEPPAAGDAAGKVAYDQTVSRMTAVKEEYAQKCKKELLILWTDYFKPEHFAKYSDLTDKILKATKQCSTVKRGIDVAAAESLKAMVTDIGNIFRATKAA